MTRWSGNDDGTEAGDPAPKEEKEKGQEAQGERGGKEVGAISRSRRGRNVFRRRRTRRIPVGRKRMGRWWPPRTSNPVGRQQCLWWVRFPHASATLFPPHGSPGNRTELRADEQEDERPGSWKAAEAQRGGPPLARGEGSELSWRFPHASANLFPKESRAVHFENTVTHPHMAPGARCSRGVSSPLRSRPSPARCRFRSRYPGSRSTGRFEEPPAALLGPGRCARIRCRI